MFQTKWCGNFTYMFKQTVVDKLGHVSKKIISAYPWGWEANDSNYLSPKEVLFFFSRFFFFLFFFFFFFLFFIFFLVERINVLRLYRSVLILETECFNDFTQMLYLLLSWVSIMLKYTHVSDDMVSRAKTLINFIVRASLHLLHCVKISGIWSFSRPYFPTLGLNTER